MTNNFVHVKIKVDNREFFIIVPLLDFFLTVRHSYHGPCIIREIFINNFIYFGLSSTFP